MGVDYELKNNMTKNTPPSGLGAPPPSHHGAPPPSHMSRPPPRP